MNFNKSEINSFYIIQIKDNELNNENNAEFRKLMEESFTSNLKVLIVDLSEVNFINSASVGILFSVTNYLSNNNKYLKVVTQKSHLLQVFDFTSFDKVAKILPTIEEAMK